MSVSKLSSETLMKIIDMCHSAAAPAIKLQCGYGFSDWGKIRATDLSSLTAQELNDLPT